MSLTFDCAQHPERELGLEAAASAVRRGALVVLPTDTVYGLGCDAFSHRGVAALLAAKGRGRDMPVPVLIGSPRTIDGLAHDVSESARELVQAFWPGALTVVVRAQPSLTWDLGDSSGTVAIRMPLHPVAIELLRETGPLAVSSANRSGLTPAATVEDAIDQLGDDVAVYLDGGPCADTLPSTIVDVTGETPVVVREGAISVELLRSVVPSTRTA